MKVLLVVVFFLTASAVWGDQVVVTATCYPPDPSQPIVTSSTATSSSCSSFGSYFEYNDTFGGASASASVSLSLASNPADWSTLTTEQSSYVLEIPSTLPAGKLGEAKTVVNMIETLTTAGALRSGYVQFAGSATSDHFYDGRGAVSSGIVDIPVAEIMCDDLDSTCSYEIAPYSLIPVTLGTSLQIETDGYTNNQAGGDDGSSGGYLDTTYQFRFFEADGVTPVLVTALPEPATWFQLALALGVAGLVRKRRLKF